MDSLAGILGHVLGAGMWKEKNHCRVWVCSLGRVTLNPQFNLFPVKQKTEAPRQGLCVLVV